MGNICEHQFEAPDNKEKDYSMTEYDLYARLRMSIRKNLKTGDFEIFRLDSKSVVFKGDLFSVVQEANRLEGAENTSIKCGSLCPKKSN